MTTQSASDGSELLVRSFREKLDRDPDRDFITDLTNLGTDWVNITLTGSRPAVTAMVNLLHQVNVIGASEWSKAIALKSSPVIIRVAARGITTR